MYTIGRYAVLCSSVVIASVTYPSAVESLYVRRQIFPIRVRWPLRCLIVVGRWYVYAATYSSVVNPLYIRRPLRRWVPVGL